MQSASETIKHWNIAHKRAINENETETMKTPRDAEEALQPLRDFFNSGGNKTELARRIAVETGRNITRQTVDRWLASNDDSRKQEPGLTVGLVLIRIGNAIMEREKEAAAFLKSEENTTTENTTTT